MTESQDTIVTSQALITHKHGHGHGHGHGHMDTHGKGLYLFFFNFNFYPAFARPMYKVAYKIKKTDKYKISTKKHKILQNLNT